MPTLEEKARTRMENILEKHSWDIWGYVRENRNSLDSGRASRIIRQGFQDAVSDVQKIVDEVVQKNEILKAEIRLLRKKVKELRG